MVYYNICFFIMVNYYLYKWLSIHLYSFWSINLLESKCMYYFSLIFPMKWQNYIFLYNYINSESKFFSILANSRSSIHILKIPQRLSSKFLTCYSTIKSNSLSKQRIHIRRVRVLLSCNKHSRRNVPFLRLPF